MKPFKRIIITSFLVMILIVTAQAQKKGTKVSIIKSQYLTSYVIPIIGFGAHGHIFVQDPKRSSGQRNWMRRNPYSKTHINNQTTK